MSHTKGPWTKEFGAFTPGYASTMRIVSEDNTHAVADVFWGSEHSSNNANLIAAAPEMIEAIEHAIGELMRAYKMTSKLEMEDHKRGAALNELVVRLNESLKAARSKARGGAK